MTVLIHFVLMQMPGPRDIVIYWPGPRAFSVVQKPWGCSVLGGGGMVTGQIDTCIKAYQKPNRLKPKGSQCRRPMREFGCESCRSKEKGSECDHCSRCGSAEHYQAGCKKRVVVVNL